MDNRNNDELEQNSHDSVYLRQNELAQKSITLQVLHNHLKVNKALCDERKILLGQEIKALDEIHSKVWDLQNTICNQVWNFSAKHDQNEIIRNYPDVSSELHVLCECERKNDAVFEENIEIEKLILEVRKLESNVKSADYESLEIELRTAEKELQACEKDSSEIESLKKEITDCEERISSLRVQLGVEYKRIESAPPGCLNNDGVPKTSSGNLKRTSTLADSPLLSAPQTNLEAPKNTCSLSERSVSDRGGFVTASTYLSTAENPMSFPSTSYEKAATEAVLNGKLSSLIKPPKKTFVVKTKSNLTQRR